MIPGGSQRIIRTCGGIGAMVLALVFAGPARAGYYSVYPLEGSGSLTVTHSDGSNTTVPLFGLGFMQSLSPGDVLTYAYSETMQYSWEPTNDDYDDLPIDTTVTLRGTAQFDFWGTPGAMYESGNASGAITMAGDSASASLTVTAGIGVTGSENVGVPQQLQADHFCSGWEGTFSLGYSGSVTISGPIVGEVSFFKDPGYMQPVKLIYVIRPRRGSQFDIENNAYPDIAIEGVWKRLPSLPSLTFTFRVLLTGTYKAFGDPDPTVALTYYVANVWNTWSWHGVFRDGTWMVTAELQYNDGSGIWANDPAPPEWTSGTMFTVKP